MTMPSLRVIAKADPADPEHKVKVKDASTGICYWMIPTDDTGKSFVLRTIQ